MAATAPSTPLTATSRGMVGTPSFVWVTSPHSSSSHQAELLEIREDGYLVKWSISGKESLISLDSVLEQELPRRTRRRGSTEESQSEEEEDEQEGLEEEEEEEAVPVFDEQNSNDSKPTNNGKPKKPEVPPTPQLVESRPPLARPRTERQLMLQFKAEEETKKEQEKEEEYVEEAKATTKPPKKKKQKTLDEKDEKNIFWKNQPRTKDGKFTKGGGKPKKSKSSAPKSTTTTTVITKKTGPQYPHPDLFISLFKLQKLVQTKTEARVAQILEPHGYAPAAAALVAEFFLFCHERQSCWQRRNNEENPEWSKSCILQQFNFCNVYRELDRGTCYVRSQFTQHFLTLTQQWKQEQLDGTKKKPKPSRVRRRDWIQKLLWTSYVYRQVNQMEPFLNFGGIPLPSDLHKYLDFVATIQDEYDDAEDVFFATTYPTPTFDDYQFHLQRLHQANGWLLKSIAGRLAQCRTLGACWDQIVNRLPGAANYPAIAWQVLCDLMESGCLLVNPHHLPAIDWIFVEPQQQKILSTCWKDRQVDDARTLDLLKLLTERQKEIFTSMGVDFPAWDGRKMSIKDLAHCLGQYSNYLKIQSDMKRNWTAGGHRFLVSKSYLDVEKACRFCHQNSDQGLFCDACLCFYCSGCEAESCAAAPDCWTCNPCKDFNQLQYVD